MKRAITSFPVPDSPVKRTVVSVAATCVAFFRTPFHSVDSPTTAACGIESTRSWIRRRPRASWDGNARYVLMSRFLHIRVFRRTTPAERCHRRPLHRLDRNREILPIDDSSVLHQESADAMPRSHEHARRTPIGPLAEYHRATATVSELRRSDRRRAPRRKRSFTAAQPLIGRTPRSCGTNKDPPINAQDAIDVAHATTPRRIHKHRGESNLPQP